MKKRRNCREIGRRERKSALEPKNLKIYPTNKPSKKRMKKSVQLLLILSLFFTGLASAQTETQTIVLIEGGASTKTSNALKAKTELILQAINGTKEFPDESGISELKTLIEEKQLVSL